MINTSANASRDEWIVTIANGSRALRIDVDQNIHFQFLDLSTIGSRKVP